MSYPPANGKQNLIPETSRVRDLTFLRYSYPAESPGNRTAPVGERKSSPVRVRSTRSRVSPREVTGVVMRDSPRLPAPRREETVPDALPVIRPKSDPVVADPNRLATPGADSVRMSRMRRILVTGSSNWVNAMAVLDTLDEELSWSPFGLGVICGEDSNVDQVIRQWTDRAMREGKNVAVLSCDPRSGNQEGRNQQMVSWGPDVCHVFTLPNSDWNWDLAIRCLEHGVQVVGHGSEARAAMLRYRTGSQGVAHAINSSVGRNAAGK